MSATTRQRKSALPDVFDSKGQRLHEGCRVLDAYLPHESYGNLGRIYQDGDQWLLEVRWADCTETWEAKMVRGRLVCDALLRHRRQAHR